MTAFLTGLPEPASGFTTGLAVLATPADPGAALGAEGLNPFAYWAVVTLFLSVLGTAGFFSGCGECTVPGRRRTRAPARRHRHRRRGRPRRLPEGPGEEGRDVAALSHRDASPERRRVSPRHGEGRAGVGDGRGLDPLLIGPPRSGKGLHVVINAILDAPGAVITTGARPDNLTATLKARAKKGKVAVFDPQQLAPGLSAGMRWSPVRGCQDPLTAMIRAKGLATATGFGGVQDAGFWEGKTTAAIQALLHAAALDGRDAKTLYQWALNPTLAADAVRVLSSHPGAAEGWADSLDAMVQADPRTRDSIWQGVSLAFSALADPRVLDAVSPRPGEEFDPEVFLRGNGTLYLLATGAGAGASSALVAAFIEDLVETARKIAARSPGARMDPPLLLALDEIGNLARSRRCRR